jgi:hypothetical protein
LAFAVLMAAALFDASQAFNNNNNTETTCTSSFATLQHYYDTFHANCNRNAYTEWKQTLGRRDKDHSFLENPNLYAAVPTQTTRYCPLTKAHELYTQNNHEGYDTTWFVTNTASTPIVLAYVDPISHQETSAFSTNIIPAQADARSVLQPGESTVVQTFEGHVFVARVLLEDGTTGMVLAQHRAGPIAVGAHATNLACPPDDPEPPIIKLETEFARPPHKVLYDCNLHQVAFRNVASCPLHVYWLVPDACHQEFRFHLGISSSAEDFRVDWASRHKLESTLMGHTLVVASAFSAQEIERITMEPTRIGDCPTTNEEKEQVGEYDFGSAAVVSDVWNHVWGHVNGTTKATTSFPNMRVFDAMESTSKHVM